MATPTPEDLKKKALETASIIEEALRSIADNVTETFENVMSGMDKTSQSVAKDIQARFNKMAKVTDDISSNAVKLQQGLLSIKGVKDQILQRTIKENSLATQLVTHLTLETKERKNIAELIEEANNGSTRLTDKQKELVKEFQNVQGINNELIEQLKEQQTEQENINKKLGISGSLIKGISKIPILGDLVKTDEALVAMNKKIAEGGGRWAAMGAGLKSIGGDIAKGLTDPLFLLTQMLEALKGADKGAGELAKGFNMTYNEAMNVREELTKMGNLSGDVALNTRALQETLMAVGKALGSNAMLNEKDLKTFTKLREQAGFTNEELLGIEKTTLATGGNLEKNTKNILYSAKLTGLNNKVLLNEKDIMRDVAKASDAIKLSLGGSGKKLGEAAAQAKALGMSLEQVDKIAGSLLDFESSITNELSAELITGKQINLEQARLYALNNDMAGLSREIAKNFGSVAEFGKMNRIQQEAAAKAVGMQREELATTLTDQATLKGLSGDKLKDAQAALDLARSQGMTEEQIAQQGIDNLMKQQSVQERLNNSVEKLKEIFIGIAEPIMQMISPIVDILLPVISTVGVIIGTMVEGVKKLFGIFTGTTKELGFWESILGSVAITLGVIKVSAMAIAGYKKLSAMFATSQAVAENATKVSILQQGLGMVKNLAKGALLLVQSMARAAAELMGVSAMTLGIGTAIAVAAGIAAYATLKSIAPTPMVTGGEIPPGYENDTYPALLSSGETVITKPMTSALNNKNSYTQQPTYDPVLLNVMKTIAQQQSQQSQRRDTIIVENSVNGTRFGTAVAMNTYKTP